MIDDTRQSADSRTSPSLAVETLTPLHRSRFNASMFGGLAFVEKAAAFLCGKGYGTATVAQEVRLALRMLGEPPHLAIDIGGNAGEYSAELRRRAPLVEIHVFEPSQTNVQKLQRRFEGDPRTVVVPYAIADRSGSATLFSDVAGSGMASLTQRRLDHFDITFDTEEAIQTMRFDDYWTRHLNQRTTDLVKIDIEGHEMDALNGMGQAIEAVRVIQFEFGGCNIDTRTFFQDFWHFFSDRHFSLYRIAPLGAQRIDRYRESDEYFSTTNYLAVNRRTMPPIDPTDMPPR